MSHSIDSIHALLPQTQCRKCGYIDCHAYATAMVEDNIPHNQCPPGGQEGIDRLALALGREQSLTLNPENGTVSPRMVAVIDPNRCIGCTLCIDACPVDAIVGTHKMLHQVINEVCTGCDLCQIPCPVDCIAMTPITTDVGWAAWSEQQAQQALERYRWHKTRTAGRLSLKQADVNDQTPLIEPHEPGVISEHPAQLNKRSLIARIMATAAERVNTPASSPPPTFSDEPSH